MAVAGIGALSNAFPEAGTAKGVGLGAHQRVDERGKQFAQHVGMGGGESFGQHRRQVDIVGSDNRVIALLE